MKPGPGRQSPGPHFRAAESAQGANIGLWLSYMWLAQFEAVLVPSLLFLPCDSSLPRAWRAFVLYDVSPLSEMKRFKEKVS